MRQETIEHAKFRAQMQTQLDSEKGVEAFEEYMRAAFPYLEATKRREKDDFIDKLNAEAKQGPMRIQPLGQPSFKSKLKRRAAGKQSKASAGANALYKKLGDTGPTT